jgi:hypothetical protein
MNSCPLRGGLHVFSSNLKESYIIILRDMLCWVTSSSMMLVIMDSVDSHTPGLFIVITHNVLIELPSLPWINESVFFCQFCDVSKVTMIHMKI